VLSGILPWRLARKGTTVPRSTIYAISSNSVVHAIDAETGETRWVTAIGRNDYPTFTISASDHLVAAINGASVTECCYVQVGDDTSSFHAQPVVLGKNGVESIPPLPALSAYEQGLLDAMRETLEGNISKGLEFANS